MEWYSLLPASRSYRVIVQSFFVERQPSKERGIEWGAARERGCSNMADDGPYGRIILLLHRVSSFVPRRNFLHNIAIWHAFVGNATTIIITTMGQFSTFFHLSKKKKKHLQLTQVKRDATEFLGAQLKMQSSKQL